MKRGERARLAAVGLLAGLVLAGCAGLSPGDESRLGEKLREETERDAPIAAVASSPLSALKERHVLFVGGFLNEGIPGYFRDNERVARSELGAETSTLFPTSLSGLTEDALVIRRAVLERFAQGKKPVVLVGHSKGGAGALLCALRWPDLVLEGKLDRVIVIQGAIGGSPVADSVVSSGPVRALPFRFRGLESLATAPSRALFKQEVDDLERKLTPLDLAWLWERVFFVRSREDEGDVALELRPTYEHLTHCGSGENDGLLLKEDMKLDGRGVDLGVVKGDHAALTVTGLLSTTSAAARRAFTRALFREVWERPSRPRPALAGEEDK